MNAGKSKRDLRSGLLEPELAEIATNWGPRKMRRMAGVFERWMCQLRLLAELTEGIKTPSKPPKISLN